MKDLFIVAVLPLLIGTGLAFLDELRKHGMSRMGFLTEWLRGEDKPL